MTAHHPLMLLPALLVLTVAQNAILLDQDSTPSKRAEQKTPAQERKPERGATDDEYSAERVLRDRAMSILDRLADSDEIDDKLQIAHMNADIAVLFCKLGDKTRALQVFKKSLTALGEHIVSPGKHADADKGAGKASASQAESWQQIELAKQISDAACECDESARTWFVRELERLRAVESERQENKDKGPTQVTDETWGTRPPVDREISGELLARAAHSSLTAENWDQAVQLLTKCLSYSVTTPFVTAVLRLKDKRPDLAESLFLDATRKVQASPTGTEIGALDFGLEAMMRDIAGDRIPRAFLDALTALINSPGSSEAAKSADMIRLIKDALPMYTAFKPAVRPQVELFIAEATRRFNPELRHVLEKPFAGQTVQQQLSSLEEIATKSPLETERDQANASIASAYIHAEKFELASRFISRITDVNLKSDLLDDLRYRLALAQIARAKDLFLVFQDISNVTSLVLRIRLYTQLGNATTETDAVLARMALDEAARLANQKLAPSPIRSHLLFRISHSYVGFDSIRAFEVLADGIKSANAHREQPSSRWGSVSADVTVVKFDRTWRFPRQVVDDPTQYKKPYDMSAFRKLAAGDFDRVLWAASTIEDKKLRASATFETCAGALLESKADQAKPPREKKPAKN
jgi:tetratricopeptide (TPR) repeat protein